jgi:hypothetical protein
MRIETSIQRIPCSVEIIYRNDPDHPADFDIEVYDRKGYRAAWLEKKLTDDDYDTIIEDLIAHNEASND